jgi:hypothetical protein
MPYSLNGQWVLPKSSCKDCSKITSDFERVFTRTMYGPFRLKHSFQTRHSKARPTALPVFTPDEHGNAWRHEVPICDFPNVYLTVNAPSPGLLLGSEQSDRNPELELNVKGDIDQLNASMEALGSTELTTHFAFEYGAYFRQVAKIGHAFAYASTGGIGYKPLLPEVILGRSPYVSHYVGGVHADLPNEALTRGLSISIVQKDVGDYLVAGVHLLGVGAIPPYQAVVGEIIDLESLITSQIERRKLRIEST